MNSVLHDCATVPLHDEALEGHERVMTGYLKPDLLIIDDFGMKQLLARSGEFLFEIVTRRYDSTSCFSKMADILNTIPRQRLVSDTDPETLQPAT